MRKHYDLLNLAALPDRQQKKITHVIGLLLVRVVKIAGGIYAGLVVIQTHRFCMETTADTGNLSRNEKWPVEIRSYEFPEKIPYTYT